MRYRNSCAWTPLCALGYPLIAVERRCIKGRHKLPLSFCSVKHEDLPRILLLCPPSRLVEVVDSRWNYLTLIDICPRTLMMELRYAVKNISWGLLKKDFEDIAGGTTDNIPLLQYNLSTADLLFAAGGNDTAVTQEGMDSQQAKFSAAPVLVLLLWYPDIRTCLPALVSGHIFQLFYPDISSTSGI